MQPPPGLRCRRRGVSLLEVTIGSMMAGMIAVMASGVALDVSRHFANNIAETQVAAEARLAIESFRRDFGGSLPEIRSGRRHQWRWVGRMIPTVNELRLCFDADQNASADWIAPDRVITYSLQGDRLIRSDSISGNVFTVARYVEDARFVINGNLIEVSIDYRIGGFNETYSFVTSDLP